jgi:uncharacterized protein (DUF2267 family)
MAFRRGRRGEAGTSAVEFALVLPLLLVIALALVQVGLVIRDRLLVEEAARAGARAAAVIRDAMPLRGGRKRPARSPQPRSRSQRTLLARMEERCKGGSVAAT